MSLASVLAIGAHPDDVVLGIGGILAELVARGHRVTVLTLTSGELAGESHAREREDERACDILGASVIFARLPDGCVTQKPAMVAIEHALRACDPSIVFVSDPKDRHQDHVAAAEATIAATRDLPNLLFYEGPSTVDFQPTSIVDITSTWQRKLDALEMHASQLASGRLAHWVHATANYRAWPMHPGKSCESLRVHRLELGLFAPPTRASVPVVTGEVHLTAVGRSREAVQ